MRKVLKQTYCRKLKQNNAFTLMEMLVAVSVIVVLLGISIIAINDLKKNLKMTELDAYAKNIYMEVQNQLAAMETEGSLEKIYTNLVASEGLYYAEYNSHRLTHAPEGYDTDEFGDSYKNMYYFSRGDSLTDKFVPPISLANDNNGSYLLEINPESGDIYSVFYWESDNEDVLAYLNAYGSDSIYKMLSGSSILPDRSKESRKDVQIGYYGGSITKTTTATSYKLNQRVELVNEEELYVKISYDYRGRMLSYKDGATTLDIKVNIIGTESGATWMPNIDIKENYYENLEEQRLETGLLLDGLGNDQDFYFLTSSMGFIPGEDLEISVETRFRQGSIDITETSRTYRVNSLFANIEKDATYTYTVSNVRHLRNLDSDYYKEIVTAPVEIILNNEIDFNNGNYSFDSEGHYVGNAARPVSEIQPIENAMLFMNDVEGRTKILGNSFVIKNLVVSAPVGTTNVGLFAQTKNVDFIKVKLEDFTLKAEGCTNVGALAGSIEGGTVSESGVYLMPYYKDASGVKRYYNQEFDSTYGNVMARHYATMSVTGGTNVGGLFGLVNACDIVECFAAVEVQGQNNVGGFIGNASNIMSNPVNVIYSKSIRDSYSSGNVRQISDAGRNIGGFIGKANKITVKNVYTTSNIYGANASGNIIGGFIGNSINSNYEACSSYGKVLNRDGNATFATDVYVGGMLSLAPVNYGNSAVENTCHFLNQLGYNTSSAFSDTELLAYSYKDFTEEGGAYSTTATSFPYDGNLLYKGFPFKAVTDNHYGNWPLPYFINTSLAYYEKYADGTYGYYSITTIEEIGDVTDESDEYLWVVDSLKDESCVEDGYALLSMYYLDNFDYATYQVKDKASNAPWVLNAEGNIKISNTYADDHAVLLRQQGFMEFKAYDWPADRNTAYNTDYTGKPIKDSFTMSGMYLYQLPYELQCTDRYGVYNFYDRLVIYDGYAKGNTGEGSQPVVGGKTIAEGEVFFYCPHFSKTAVNPGLGTATMDRLPNPDSVAVRSARQLNALGRMPYYWNKKGGSIPMSYEQEVDINFSTYTNYTKEYCGREFNLLAFDQPYSNKPIGEWDRLPGGYGSFQNDYNGNYHKIIDYCVKSDKQYVGLFGEIYKEGGATRSQIQNVIMTVSEAKKGNTGNYQTASSVKDQDNAGLIIGTFEDTTNPRNSEDRLRAATGALVGSDYTIGQTDGEAKVYTIYNCAVSGYRVEYHINKPQKGGQQPLGIALGGLVGYSRGNIAQSTVANDIRLLINDSITGDTAAAMVGGFAGSFYYGTILNCYSGGTIDVDDNDGKYYLNRLRIAGFCPGWLDAPGVSNEYSNEIVRYQNVYTYTAVSENVWNVRESNNGKYFNHLIPVIGRMKLVYENRLVGFFDWDTKWHTDSENNDDHFVRVPGFAYYLTSVISNNMVDRSEAKDYFQNKNKNNLKTCDPARYDQLSNLSWVNTNSDFKNYQGKYQAVAFQTTNLYPALKKAVHSYADNTKAYEGQSYPFPAFVKDAEGNYVHYGDWPLN